MGAREEDYDVVSDEDVSGLADELKISSFDGLQLPSTHNECVRVVKPQSVAHFHCPNTLPLPALWPDRPLLLRPSSVHGTDPLSEKDPVRISGAPFDFETDVFKGKIKLRLCSDPACAQYFKGKKRLNSVVVTGQFKRPVPFASLVTGQEFCHHIKSPGSMMSRAILKCIQMLAPLLKIRLATPTDPVSGTCFLSPLVQSAQTMHAGTTPFDLHAHSNIVEDTTLVGDRLAAKPLDSQGRKKFFSNEKNLEGLQFETDKHYTFDFYTDKIEMETFTLHILSQRFDLCKYLLGQPIRVLARLLGDGATGASAYAWNFEVWHESQTSSMPCDC